jgi:hypothetical protein
MQDNSEASDSFRTYITHFIITIWRSHGCEHEEYYVLGYDAVYA